MYRQSVKHPGAMIAGKMNCEVVLIRADFWEGDATKHFSVRKKGFFFSEKGGGNSVNEGFW